MSTRTRRRNKRGKAAGKNKLAIIVVVIFALGMVIGYYRSNSDSKPNQELSSVMIAKGRELYNTNCVKCHGVKGSGAYDKIGNLLAPPLDDSAHAWHHTDEALIKIILEGSPRNPKMIAWKVILSEDDAGVLVEYIKSLWSPRIRNECQGPKHMRCMQGMM